MGYCGSGVGMASYLGMRVGQQVLGLKKETAFDGAFQTRPRSTGHPGFSRRPSCTTDGKMVAWHVRHPCDRDGGCI